VHTLNKVDFVLVDLIILTKTVCGNKEIEASEQCDDGGVIASDGCGATCLIEAGFECKEVPSVCNLICSNGEVNTGEECDDKNLINGDGCDSTCKIEANYECQEIPSSCNLICSNGEINSGE